MKGAHTNHVGSSSPWHLIPLGSFELEGQGGLTRGDRNWKKGFRGAARVAVVAAEVVSSSWAP
jgi:hypothetical protein